MLTGVNATRMELLRLKRRLIWPKGGTGFLRTKETSL